MLICLTILSQLVDFILFFTGGCQCPVNLSVQLTTCFLCFYPAPDRETGYCFRVISLYVSLSATLRENSWTDLHEIFREGVEWPWDNLIKFWVNSGRRVGGSKVDLFVITGHSSGLALTSQYHSLGGSRGRGLRHNSLFLIILSFEQIKMYVCMYVYDVRDFQLSLRDRRGDSKRRRRNSTHWTQKRRRRQ